MYIVRFWLASLAVMGNNEKIFSFDKRSTLSRSEARTVYDGFAESGHAGGKDADSGYGGPAVKALMEMADFESAKSVLDYGCGQGKLAELVLSETKRSNKDLYWKGIDQSPNMVEKFTERCVEKFGADKCAVELLEDGEPSSVHVKANSVDRFVSTYCLDLLSEEDMYAVLNLAERCLTPDGKLLLSGITWGYKASVKTFAMTLVWELLYVIQRRKVGGCRPQALQPSLKSKGWRIENSVNTLPNGFPWMVSEVIVARPPLDNEKGE